MGDWGGEIIMEFLKVFTGDVGGKTGSCIEG